MPILHNDAYWFFCAIRRQSSFLLCISFNRAAAGAAQNDGGRLRSGGRCQPLASKNACVAAAVCHGHVLCAVFAMAERMIMAGGRREPDNNPAQAAGTGTGGEGDFRRNGGSPTPRPRTAAGADPDDPDKQPRRWYLYFLFFFLCFFLLPMVGLLLFFMGVVVHYTRKLNDLNAGGRRSAAPPRKKRPQRNARSAPRWERAPPLSRTTAAVASYNHHRLLVHLHTFTDDLVDNHRRLLYY